MKRFQSASFQILLLIALFLQSGCGGGYLKGVNASGQKVYLGPLPIEDTPAYKEYSESAQTEVDKQRYLFQRLKSTNDLQFFHDGSWYNAVEAYRGGMWLMRKRYVKGQSTRDFIRKYVERSDAGKLHLVKYPDGSLQIGSYVLYNELELLEKTAGSARTKA